MIKKTLTLSMLFTLIFLVITVKFSSESISGNSTGENVRIPILMYHGLTVKSSQVNEYFIPVSTFENDLKYLKENNYTTVTPHDLINYVNGKFKMPLKPIMLTFDDGYCNNYNYAYPLLKKYRMTALVSIIGKPCQTATDAVYRAEDYCNMTWGQIEEISDSGCFEIGNHTWDLHTAKGNRKGASAYTGEDENLYRKMLYTDLSTVQKQIKKFTGMSPVAFAWPYGFTSRCAKPVFDKLNIKLTLTCYDGVSTIKKGDPSSLFDLKRFLRTPASSLQQFLKN